MMVYLKRFHRSRSSHVTGQTLSMSHDGGGLVSSPGLEPGLDGSLGQKRTRGRG